jgi:hypothetical protein
MSFGGFGVPPTPPHFGRGQAARGEYGRSPGTGGRGRGPGQTPGTRGRGRGNDNPQETPLGPGHRIPPVNPNVPPPPPGKRKPANQGSINRTKNIVPRILAPVFNAIKKANNAAAKKAANNAAAAAKKAANNAAAAAKAKQRHAKLKAEIISLKNMVAKRSNSGGSGIRELRELAMEQQRALLRQMREREKRAHRYSSIRGTPTNYYNRNFHRLYRVPRSHQGLNEYYYYQQHGGPRYLQQLPGRVWKLNQGGRGLPPVPFYPSRRRVRRVPRWVR